MANENEKSLNYFGIIMEAAALIEHKVENSCLDHGSTEKINEQLKRINHSAIEAAGQSAIPAGGYRRTLAEAHQELRTLENRISVIHLQGLGKREKDKVCQAWRLLKEVVESLPTEPNIA